MDSIRYQNRRSKAQGVLEFPTFPIRKKHARLKGAKLGVAGLFAGIGGIEKGLHVAGHRTVLLCENDPAASRVLADRFSDIPLHDDVRTLEKLSSGVTLLTAGFPCQDLSQAGKTAGILGRRSGLVGEVFRLLRSHRTPWVLLENVPFMLQLGQGRAMNVIVSALEELGYRWAYRVVDSRVFGLPQRRRRVYLVASLEGDPRSVLFADEKGDFLSVEDRRFDPRVACGFYWTEGIRGLGWASDAVPTLKGGSTIGIPSAPAILLPSGEVITPDIRDAERLQGFPVDWTKPAQKVGKTGHRWKLVGNAVSVAAAAWIGRRFLHPGGVIDFPARPLNPNRTWPNAAWNVSSRRCEVSASEWPVHRPYRSLSSFLRFPGHPLSAKATAGFLARTERSSLRFPDGFLAALESHLARTSRATRSTVLVPRVAARQPAAV